MSTSNVNSIAALRVTELTKEYPTPAEPLRVLGGVSFQVAPGESLAVLGVSGSGKSTLLNILGTLDAPTAGQVRLGDVDPFALPADRLAAFRAERVGFVFQDHHLLPQLTALENLLVARLALGRTSDADRRHALDLLDRVGLADRADHRPAELSGGQRQRVALARALMNRPALLLADEPTGNLDAATADVVARLLRELAADSGAVLVVATHADELAGLMSRRCHLRDGLLVDAP